MAPGVDLTHRHRDTQACRYRDTWTHRLTDTGDTEKCLIRVE
ncbi:rCG22228 [Rattus norvegicus]|uniref:RCG22228 n=1 Tax=Rattus norvegicus TaxID=10116 RepID=A6INB8_RAT|nr:rCG22228 [Rattus norvegicus]